MLWFRILLFSLAALSATLCNAGRSFSIDEINNTFLKDGKPFNYVSGSMHYSRVPFYYWSDRLGKMYAAGLDAVQTYIPWNVHEPSPGVYDFTEQQDLVGFISKAQAAGLLVILRAGPYICGEWEYGGFPPWILAKNGSVVVRTMDPGFIAPVDRWLSVLLPKIKPLLYENGGPVIMVQVENEYGSYFACDRTYTAHLRDVFRKYLGDTAVLFTTDGSGLNFLKCGAIPGVFTTVDFGPGGNTSANFNPMRIHNQNKGPLVNSEFYTGWLDYWGQNHAHGDTTNICRSLDSILSMGANINMYMFEGGTSFGYMNGADPPFNICPTSYDYDAPLTEAGDITPKYMAIRSVIGMYKTLPDVPVPSSTMKYAYGSVQMHFTGTVLDLLETISPNTPVESEYPLSMEEKRQNYGFILYRTTLPKPKSVNGSSIQVPGLRDRAHVLLDGHPCGVLNRKVITSMALNWTEGQTLDLIVENQGRVSFGTSINLNRKGIITNVSLSDSTVLTKWQIYSLNFTKLFDQDVQNSTTTGSAAPNLPSVFSGDFVIPDQSGLPADTYLRMDGWSKGQAFINGFNLGRYWPDKGPQITMYVPYQLIRPHPLHNTVVLVELDYTHQPCQKASSCKVEFVDTPKLNGTVHKSHALKFQGFEQRNRVKVDTMNGYDLL